MKTTNALLFIVSNVISSTLFAQNYSAKDISEKSNNAISNFKKGFFTIHAKWKPETFSGDIIFYKDSVKEDEIPQFFLVQDNDTVLVYNGNNYFFINNKTKLIRIYKGLAGKLNLGLSGEIGELEDKAESILEFADIYFRKASAPLCWDTYPYKIEGIKKVDGNYCYAIKDTLNEHLTEAKNAMAYGFTYIDTSSYLPIRKVQICKDGERTLTFSHIRHLKESDHFKFDVNLFANRRGYKIEKAGTR
ncbi:MAG TPA: hypothetical protein VJY62_14660 [Bacteroidia bacterium]|nr:hypothetical protein [Bacteroidia bacterium]